MDRVKAFDKVRHKPLLDILQGLYIEGAEVELLQSLHWDQQAAVKVNGILSEYVDI